MQCPCHSGKNYSACCEPYHQGLPAPTSLALMRSRYSAYAMHNADYIIKTTHPLSPHFETDRKKWKQAILQFCSMTQFLDLKIIDSGVDWVHFQAFLKQNDRFILEEKSTFEKGETGWVFLKGDSHIKNL